MKITLRQLEVFVAIAKVDNMSRAAEALFLSQSACSMALTTLEDQLNAKLFDRHHKSLLLNEKGKRVLTQAINIMAQIEELPFHMAGDENLPLSGLLKIGASTTLGSYILPNLIGQFIQQHPQTKLTLGINNTKEIIQQLLHLNVDIGFIEGDCDERELDVIPWYKDQLVIVATPSYSLARKRKISLNDLKKEKWILREPGSGTRNKFEQAIGDKITPLLEFGNTESIKQAVIAGIGISCLSQAAVSSALERGDLIAIKTPFLTLERNFYILHHKQRYQTKLINEFMTHILSK